MTGRREDQRFFASPRVHDREAGVPEIVIDYLSDPRVILDDQNRQQGGSPSAVRVPAGAIPQTPAARHGRLRNNRDATGGPRTGSVR